MGSLNASLESRRMLVYSPMICPPVAPIMQRKSLTNVVVFASARARPFRTPLAMFKAPTACQRGRVC